MIQFILNQIQIRTDLPGGMTLLDFVRYERNLSGTKIGCREGDCGACTVLVGELTSGKVLYRTMTSCLMPLSNAHGKHIVTIEGINFPGLNPVQQAMSDEGATQCGFCTPGFVMSLTGFCMQNETSDPIAAIDGNICRCTGYKSIERAAQKVSAQLKGRKGKDPVAYAVLNKFIPDYFSDIPKRMKELNLSSSGRNGSEGKSIYVGGGTDLYVQKHEQMVHASSTYLADQAVLKGIRREKNMIRLGASVTVTDMMRSEIINELFPAFPKYAKLVSSTPIRNMATLAGNFVNASPIGDFTVFFLALDAGLVMNNSSVDRSITLRNFYHGYKRTDRKDDEHIREITFVADENMLFNFEKVSKRTNLDIASVNSAIAITLQNGKIKSCGLSAGGVGPIPMFLKKSSEYLIGKEVSEEVVMEVCEIAGGEITPISDARGSATYKRFLLQQLIRSHFITLFKNIRPEKLQSTYEEY